MHEMEEGVRSSEGLVKKKNSSGCLVIKKKVDGSRKVIESNKERKRPRLVLSDSGSSDESEPCQRKVVTKTGSFQNGSVGQNGETDSERKRRLDVFDFDENENMNDYEHHRFKRTSRKWNESEFDSGSSRSLMIEKRKKSYFDSGSNSSSGGRKRAPNYTFKDSLEVDDDEAHLPISSFRHKVRVPSDEPIRLQGKNGVLKVMVNNKKKMDVPHKFGDRQMEVGDRKGSKSENAIRKKNVSIGPSFYSESKSSEKPISVVRTDKSGLKTRKPVSKSLKGGNSETEDSDTSLRQGPTSGQASKGVRKSEEKAPSAERITPVRAEKSEIKVRRPLSKSVKGGDSETEDSDSSLRRGPASGQALKGVRKSGDKAPSAERITPIRAGKSEVKVRRSLSKRVKGGDSETDDSDSSLRREPRSGQAHGSSKRVRRSEEKAPSAEKITPGRGKEVKIKRGSGTEKQLLREKIRDMLISVGWTIDYRPRRNRDYLDSVYISPTGTAYWSIIKAYDALQKQQDEDDAEIKPSGDSSLFTPLPDELLSKLTRQTRKKIEKEMKLKRKNARTKRGKERREVSAEDTGKSQKGRSDETSNVSVDDSSSDLSPKRERSGKQSTATNSHLMQGRKSRKIGRCTLLVRSSDKRVNSQSDGYVPYSGKRTVLSWLIDSGVVHLSERVQYMNRKKTRTLLEGWINRDGIHCGCCSKILTVPKFEIHAGNKPRHPFQHIYLESGISLLQCQVDAWNKQESKRSGFHTVGTDGDDPDDDTCGLCGDGGDLICCDGCPSTFHQSCLDIQMLPPGDWHCPNCICKFCGIAGEVSADGDHPTVSALLTCSLCEKKYHASCRQEVEPADVNCASTSFCGIKCRELFDSLQKLLGVKHELEAGLSWSLIHRTDIDADASHRGFPQRVECNSKLAVALSVMDECFLTIVDRRSGINLIHNVLYNCGSNFSRLNYSSFYTAILERGDEIVAAASIRIRGTQLAEMPFIGTRHIYRRQGMCRRLLSAIELVLCSLKVEKLFIPAIAEHMNTWTTVFGFNPLEESHKQELRSMNMLVFPGTDMLQKPLVEQKTTEENITANSDTKSILIKEDLCLAPDLAKKSDADSSADHDFDIGDSVIIQNSDDVDEKAAAVDSSMDALAVPSHDNAVLNSLADVSCEPKIEVVSEENVSLHSQQVEKSTDSPGDSIKCPPSSNLHHDLIKMENPALDPSVQIKSSEEGIVGYVDEANIEAAVAEPVLDSSGGISTMDTAEGINGDKKPLLVCTVDETDEGIVGDVHGANIKASVGEQVLDSVEGISTMDTAEGINGDKKPLSLSTVDETDETLTESNSDLSPRISDRMEYKLHTTSESEAKVDEPVEGNIQSFVDGIKDDNHDAEVKVLHSLGEISAMKGKNEIPDPVSMACSNGNDECSVQLASDLNQPDALDLSNKMIVASLVSSAEVASNAEVVMVEGGNIQSSAASNSGDAPLLDSLDDSSTQKIPEEVNDKLHHVPLSNLCAKDESIKQCNSNWNNQSICEVESEVPVASEVSCEADVAPVKNDIRTSAVGGIDENVNEGKVASVEPVLDSLQEISARENDVHGDPDPASVSTLNISAESAIQVNSDWNKQNSLEVESNLHAASEVALDGSKILSRAEDGIGEDAQEAENATEEFKASVAVPSIDEADGSFVAFEYDQNSHRNAMETELS